MTKNRKISESQVITHYMDFVSEHGNKPDSIESLAEFYNFDSNYFYDYFTSFKELEKHIYNLLFLNSLSILEQSPGYFNFDKKDKLLSLYYTFFENLALNEAYVKVNLKGLEYQLKALSSFSLFKKSFIGFMKGLNIETLSFNLEKVEKIQKKSIYEGAWVQMLLVIKFWIEDDSKDFEKTDIFIEKFINTSYELIDTKSFQNIIDLAKFLYKEKLQ